MNLWSSFEGLSRPSAVPAIWQARLGNEFAPFSAAFLEAKPRTVLSYPCPRHCGCGHRVVPHTDGSIVGVCQCKPRVCDNIDLTVPDITPLELNWPKFARAISKAFGLASKFESFSARYTAQIGSWSADPVPVFLTIQSDPNEFRHVVASLVARLHCRFILLAPTGSFMDAASLGYLANIGAEFFPLESHLILTEHGTFKPTKAPGELFARFRPEPKEAPGEDVARQTLALAKALDSEQRFRKAPVYTVLLLYCAELMSVNQIAKRCRCARSVVFTRMKLLRQLLGRHPSELRQYSAEYEKMDQSLSDPRAREIYRKGAAYGDEDGQNE